MFSSKPKLVTIIAEDITSYTACGFNLISNSSFGTVCAYNFINSTFFGFVKVTWSESILNFYIAYEGSELDEAQAQLNKQGVTYQYLAILQ